MEAELTIDLGATSRDCFEIDIASNRLATFIVGAAEQHDSDVEKVVLYIPQSCLLPEDLYLLSDKENDEWDEAEPVALEYTNVNLHDEYDPKPHLLAKLDDLIKTHGLLFPESGISQEDVMGWTAMDQSSLPCELLRYELYLAMQDQKTLIVIVDEDGEELVSNADEPELYIEFVKRALSSVTFPNDDAIRDFLSMMYLGPERQTLAFELMRRIG